MVQGEGFDQRSGITLAGGSLLGVTTALATVQDKWGSEVGERHIRRCREVASIPSERGQAIHSTDGLG